MDRLSRNWFPGNGVDVVKCSGTELRTIKHYSLIFANIRMQRFHFKCAVCVFKKGITLGKLNRLRLNRGSQGGPSSEVVNPVCGTMSRGGLSDTHLSTSQTRSGEKFSQHAVPVTKELHTYTHTQRQKCTHEDIFILCKTL